MHASYAVFLTTHYIEEADELCDRIAVLVKGKIVNIAMHACLGPFLNGFFQHVNELDCLLHALLPKCFGSDVKAQFSAQFRW
jgi:ABC-type multidrug transport system ATPase subunit